MDHMWRKTIEGMAENYISKHNIFKREAFIIRPIVPNDFGKNNWVWDTTKGNVINVNSNCHLVLISGIWSTNHIVVTIKTGCGNPDLYYDCISVLTNGTEAYNPLVFNTQDCALIKCYNKGLNHSQEIEFSFIGHVLELKGITINK